MHTDGILLGIDGGASQTHALIADASGRVLGTGTASASNYQSVGFDLATEALLTAIGRAKDAAGIARETPLDVACFGLAGIGRPDDRARFETWAAEHGIAQRSNFVSDAELVLAAGTEEGWGVALIAGTGSFCWGRAADGRTARVGGWGYLLGDEGSGYDLALQALRLAAQTADGRTRANDLLQAILAHWSLDEPAGLIPYIYHPKRTRAEIAGVIAPVLALADAGDTYAGALIERAAADLARMLFTLIDKLGLQQPPVALAGGLLGASPTLRASIAERVPAVLGPVVYVGEPAHGALALARRLIS